MKFGTLLPIALYLNAEVASRRHPDLTPEVARAWSAEGTLVQHVESLCPAAAFEHVTDQERAQLERKAAIYLAEGPGGDDLVSMETGSGLAVVQEIVIRLMLVNMEGMVEIPVYDSRHFQTK